MWGTGNDDISYMGHWGAVKLFPRTLLFRNFVWGVGLIQRFSVLSHYFALSVGFCFVISFFFWTSFYLFC